MFFRVSFRDTATCHGSLHLTFYPQTLPRRGCRRGRLTGPTCTFRGRRLRTRRARGPCRRWRRRWLTTPRSGPPRVSRVSSVMARTGVVALDTPQLCLLLHLPLLMFSEQLASASLPVSLQVCPKGFSFEKCFRVRACLRGRPQGVP